jgi:HAE1 family hydrophobic/amphiphilic exporter-1
MASLPLALVGVMLGLMAGGSTLNMFSMIGFIMLMGLVVKNAILLVDNANQQMREQGMNLYDALLAAGTTRFRPIIMTSLAMIFGMLLTYVDSFGRMARRWFPKAPEDETPDGAPLQTGHS